jgi:hypothetical protein
MAGHQIRHGGRHAAIGHVVHFNAGAQAKIFGDEMIDPAGAGGAIVNRARPFARQAYQVGQAACRKIRMHQHNEG